MWLGKKKSCHGAMDLQRGEAIRPHRKATQTLLIDECNRHTIVPSECGTTALPQATTSGQENKNSRTLND